MSPGRLGFGDVADNDVSARHNDAGDTTEQTGLAGPVEMVAGWVASRWWGLGLKCFLRRGLLGQRAEKPLPFHERAGFADARRAAVTTS